MRLTFNPLYLRVVERKKHEGSPAHIFLNNGSDKGDIQYLRGNKTKASVVCSITVLIKQQDNADGYCHINPVHALKWIKQCFLLQRKVNCNFEQEKSFCQLMCCIWVLILTYSQSSRDFNVLLLHTSGLRLAREH